VHCPTAKKRVVRRAGDGVAGVKLEHLATRRLLGGLDVVCHADHAGETAHLGADGGRGCRRGGGVGDRDLQLDGICFVSHQGEKVGGGGWGI
jgi:hypothetical protein